MMSDKSSRVCAKICISLLSVFVLILFCIIFVFWYGLLFVFRWLVSKLTTLFRPDLHKWLDPIGALYFGEGIQAQLHGNVTITVKIGGPVNPAQLIAKIEDIFLNSKSENGNPKYAEFKMYPELWIGYPFWKLENDFKFAEHVRCEIIPVQIDSVDEEEFVSDHENETLKSHLRLEKSPWEITLFTGRHDNSYVIVKFHHVLCDGESILNLLMKVADNYVPRIQKHQTSTLLNIWKAITLPFFASYDVTENFFRNSPASPLPTWTLPVEEMSRDTRVILKSREVVSCAKVKAVSSKHDVSFSSVLLSAISGGVHNYLTKKGDPVQESWLVFLPLPLPNHPDSLSNHFTGVPVNLPVGQSNPINRLQICEKELQNVKQSTSGALFVLKTRLLTVLPRCFSSNKEPAYVFPLGLSIFASSAAPVTVQGFPILDMHYKLCQVRRSSVFVTLCSYNGRIRIVCNADPKIFATRDHAEEFLDEINNEFNAMFV